MPVVLHQTPTQGTQWHTLISIQHHTLERGIVLTPAK